MSITTETALRNQLRNIVTRNGKSGRIPEILEAELDDLVALIKQYGTESRLEELEQVEAIPSEVGKLANHSLKVSEYLEDRINELKQKETK